VFIGKLLYRCLGGRYEVKLQSWQNNVISEYHKYQNIYYYMRYNIGVWNVLGIRNVLSEIELIQISYSFTWHFWDPKTFVCGAFAMYMYYYMHVEICNSYYSSSGVVHAHHNNNNEMIISYYFVMLLGTCYYYYCNIRLRRISARRYQT